MLSIQSIVHEAAALLLLVGGALRCLHHGRSCSCAAAVPSHPQVHVLLLSTQTAGQHIWLLVLTLACSCLPQAARALQLSHPISNSRPSPADPSEPPAAESPVSPSLEQEPVRSSSRRCCRSRLCLLLIQKKNVCCIGLCCCPSLSGDLRWY